MKPISGKRFIKILESHGWVFSRIQGSHSIYTKTGHEGTISVPIHGNKLLKIGLLKHLMRIAGLSEDDIQK